jgi:hypothetical protein
MSVAENLTVEQPVQTPAPILDTPSPAPIVETPAPEADKRPTLREGLESSLKAIRDRPRDDAGRFTQAQKDAAAAAKAQQPAPVTPQPVVAQRPPDMPKAWAADKAQYWASMSPEQRAYITERETQMEAFHAKHAGLAQWQEAAQQNGTTLNEVLERVHAVESAMASDPASGLVQACQMVGLDRQGAISALQGALKSLGVVQTGLSNPAEAYPSAGRDQSATPNQQPVTDPRYAELEQRFNSITQTLQQQELAKAGEAVKAFASDPANKFYNDVSDDIVRELKKMRAVGEPVDLKTAYERACWGREDIRKQLVAEQVAQQVPAAVATKTQELDKSRSASRSVAGSPPVAEGRSSADQPSKLRDQIAQGVRTAMGSRA